LDHIIAVLARAEAPTPAEIHAASEVFAAYSEARNEDGGYHPRDVVALGALARAVSGVRSA
jgi:hypothetical protein